MSHSRSVIQSRTSRLEVQTDNHRVEPLAQDVQHLVHELQVHQIELERQNDELRRSHLALDIARARYFDLYDLAPVGYVTVGVDGLILEANLTAATLLGVDRRSLVQRQLHTFVAKEDQDIFYLLCGQLRETGAPQSREIRMNPKGGHQLWVHVMATATVSDEGVDALRMVLSDISALKSIERQLDHQAHFDALTDLPNRRLQADRLQQAMAQARRTGLGLSVVYIDLDGFKAINDQFGHEVGDQMLVALASQMQQVLREGDTLARMGGDEFTALLINLGDIYTCASTLDRLLEAAAKPMQFKDHLLQVSASLGVTFYPQPQEVDGDHLIRQADQAMYLAKQAGKNRYEVFMPAGPPAAVSGQNEELQRFQQALAQGEVVLHYLPKVNLRRGQLVGAEALIRWQHPEKGLLGPTAFLSIVKDHALAIDLGEWAIDTALGQIGAWQVQGLAVMVNVSLGAHHLQQTNFVARLRSLLARHPDVSPKLLTLETPEASALKDMPRAVRVINECLQLGVAVAQGRLPMQLGCDVAQACCPARPMPAQDLPGWVADWLAEWGEHRL